MKRRLVLAGLVVAVAVMAVATRTRWLPLPAEWLDVNDDVARADVMFVLSGNSLWRAEEAARLYKIHAAPSIIVSGGGPSEYYTALTGELVNDAELNARVLCRMGVPRNVMVVLNGMHSTQQEAIAFRNYASVHRVHSVILVTSHLHARRARMAFRRVLGSNTVVMARDAPQADVDVHSWWKDPDAALTVLNEYLKFGYYLLRY